ncbi:hypothetical protein ABG768_016144 [Culter alburnus]|uniref:Ig-like domain-containing protein n=1 Tax=Culter alburnus TaxID=194366 RepID=A0AAW1YZB9_CULAL
MVTLTTFNNIHNYLHNCSDTVKESMCGSDGEEIRHADFTQKMGVNTLPDFADPLSFPGSYEESTADQEVCKQSLTVCIKAYQSPPEEMDSPETSIYPKNDVQLGVENTIICHVTGFFPPPVSYRPRNDGTFHIFSSLKIIPEERDIYSCTVNHRALQGPQTKIWGIQEMAAVRPSVGPALFCGAGFTLALLGVATGIFFFVKGAVTDNTDIAKKEKHFMQWTPPIKTVSRGF